jgi:hypothetical protein
VVPYAGFTFFFRQPALVSSLLPVELLEEQIQVFISCSVGIFGSCSQVTTLSVSRLNLKPGQKFIVWSWLIWSASTLCPASKLSSGAISGNQSGISAGSIASADRFPACHGDLVSKRWVSHHTPSGNQGFYPLLVEQHHSFVAAFSRSPFW